MASGQRRRKVVLASGNQGKLKEFSRIFSELDMEVYPQSDFALQDVAETGLTFVENAIIKARAAAEKSGLPAIADDSGLEVDYLNGAPGIYSARYSGEGDKANNQKLLIALSDVPVPQRSARFQCALVYMRHALDPTPIICQAAWEGRILLAEQGGGGFGYDPLFWVDEHGCSAAELPQDVKNRISHRAQASAKLFEALRMAQ